MVNHLQLLLGLAVAPSLPITSDAGPNVQLARSLRYRLAFTHSLTRSTGGRIALGRYEDYAAHYEHEAGAALTRGDLFVPTAALVDLQSSANGWSGVQFVLSAAKAVHERRLEVRILFKNSPTRDDNVGANDADDCELRVTIQTHANASTEHSQRIEWSCTFLDGLVTPSGWQYDRLDRRAMHPSTPATDCRLPWQLGDTVSAYDVLLREVSNGNRQLFASVDEAIASWSLWTPIVQQVERATLSLSTSDLVTRVASRSRSSYIVYPTGSASWNGVQTLKPTPATRSEHIDEL